MAGEPDYPRIKFTPVGRAILPPHRAPRRLSRIGILFHYTRRRYCIPRDFSSALKSAISVYLVCQRSGNGAKHLRRDNYDIREPPGISIFEVKDRLCNPIRTYIHTYYLFGVIFGSEGLSFTGGVDQQKLIIIPSLSSTAQRWLSAD